MEYLANIVKICGLRDVEHAFVAADAGADALGFIMAPSRRQVEPALVVEVRDHLASMPVRPRLVAVVVNEPEDALREIVEQAQPDVVQLSGDESASTLGALSTAVFRTVRVPDGASMDIVRGMVDPWFDHARPVEAVLIEARSPGHYGGTGKVVDWELAARLAETYPVILAGGLTPQNVGASIATVRPGGVDVSSGVEHEGVKSTERIRQFIRAAHQGYDATLGSARQT